MLKRGDSDFQWFKARTEADTTHIEPRYIAMATIDAPLNAETSQPKERSDHNLPPKTYANAVAGSQSGGGAIDAASHSGPNGASQADGISSATAGNVNGFPPSHDTKEPSDAKKIVYEQHADSDSGRLTSIKPDPSYLMVLRHEEDSAPRKNRSSKMDKSLQQQNGRAQLSSGRRAGAGWERSA